jgi:TatD DNase family protein
MELFDSHFHYYRESEEKNNMTMQDYYAFCEADNPTYLMAVAGSYEGSLLAKEFAENFERAYFAVGVHPHDADDYLSKREDFSMSLSSASPSAVAISSYIFSRRALISSRYENAPLKYSITVWLLSKVACWSK